MKFKRHYFLNYVKEAPLTLAIERAFECELLSKQKFNRPILDLGCGEGLFAYILFDEPVDVGIDPNNQELEKAKKYGMHKVLINCFGEKIPKESDSFNTIFSNSVLEHIPDIEPVLKEAYRLLTAQGEFYITVPTNLFDRYSIIYQIFILLRLDSMAERYQIFFNNFWKHYHHYDNEGWIKLFQKNGFEVKIRKEYCNKNVCLLNDALTPLSLPGYLSKKILNRWFLFYRIRKYYSFVLYLIFKRIYTAERTIKKAGLLFYCLRKIP